MSKKETQRKSSKPNTIAKQQSSVSINVDGLPDEIKLFLDNAKGRYPFIRTPSGAIYVGEMAKQQ